MERIFRSKNRLHLKVRICGAERVLPVIVYVETQDLSELSARAQQFYEDLLQVLTANIQNLTIWVDANVRRSDSNVKHNETASESRILYGKKVKLMFEDRPVTSSISVLEPLGRRGQREDSFANIRMTTQTLVVQLFPLHSSIDREPEIPET